MHALFSVCTCMLCSLCARALAVSVEHALSLSVLNTFSHSQAEETTVKAKKSSGGAAAKKPSSGAGKSAAGGGGGGGRGGGKGKGGAGGATAGAMEPPDQPEPSLSVSQIPMSHALFAHCSSLVPRLSRAY